MSLLNEYLKLSCSKNSTSLWHRQCVLFSESDREGNEERHSYVLHMLHSFVVIFFVFLQTHEPETRKPAFRWLGWRGSVQGGNESRKRLFGADITNYDSKKPRMQSSGNWRSGQKQKILIKHEDSENSLDSPSYVFGPFAPDSIMTKVSVSEILGSTYRPHYQNQGTNFSWIGTKVLFLIKNNLKVLSLSSCPVLPWPDFSFFYTKSQKMDFVDDMAVLSDLFRHYMDAWKSWYTEVDRPIIWIEFHGGFTECTAGNRSRFS